MNVVIKLFLTHAFFYQLTSGFECIGITNSINTEIYDYYWRDYFGIIPPDALPGGKDSAGNPTYIGQAYIRNKEFLPGTIHSGCKNIQVSAYNQELNNDKNIKILCVKNPQNYAWIQTTAEQVHLLTQYHIIEGGSEVGYNLYIGRVNHEGRVIVGKIFPHPASNKGLWVPNIRKKETNFLSFEILVYIPESQRTTPNKENHTCDWLLDVRSN